MLNIDWQPAGGLTVTVNVVGTDWEGGEKENPTILGRGKKKAADVRWEWWFGFGAGCEEGTGAEEVEVWMVEEW